MTINKEARRNKVLDAIVRYHIKSASPVGSKHIARNLKLSSATIRSVMFELEKEGLLKQPYTSAGRVPTDLGYRKYVDNIISFEESLEDDIYMHVKQYVNRKKFFEEIIEYTSHAIAELTNYTGIALSPSNKLYFDGTYHMLEQPEFRELAMARDFLRIIEEKNELINLMHEDLEAKGMSIRIGRENIFEELRECTIITSAYRYKDHISGNIGVIGPMRMKYEEIVPIVEHLAEMTTKALREITQ